LEVKKNILVAPLNWGLGHATRSIPIIWALEENGFNPIIASDGQALKLLKKNFRICSIWNFLLITFNMRRKGKISNGNY
jgi:hypothetical protein